MKSSIIIPAYNQWDFTDSCIANIKNFTNTSSIEIIVIDDASTDNTSANLNKKYPDVICARNENNLGFSKSVNRGIRLAKGEYILLLNNDAVPSHRWLDNMLTVLNSDKSIGLVGPLSNYVLYPQLLPISITDMNSIHKFCYQYNLSDKRKWSTAYALSGFCLLFRKSLVDEIGFFDETMDYGYCEDLDYSVRARMAGYHCAIAGDVYVHHWGKQTFSKEEGEKNMIHLEKNNRLKLKSKWPDLDI